MGLVKFGPWRVGFWVVARGISAADELPAGLTARTWGTPSDDLRALVVAAADDAGAVRWASVLHGDGAAVLLEWRGALFVAMGPLAVVLDTDGLPVAERRFDAEVTAAFVVGEELLLLSPGRVQLVDAGLRSRWSRPLTAERLHFLGAEEGALRLVAMTGETWAEHLLDPRTGASLTEG